MGELAERGETHWLMPALGLAYLGLVPIAELGADSSEYSVFKPVPRARRSFLWSWLTVSPDQVDLRCRGSFPFFLHFDLITCSSEGLRSDMGQISDPSLWVSVFISKMRGKLILVFQLFFFLYQKFCLINLMPLWTQCFERSCLPVQTAFITNGLWILASLEANPCHYTSLVKSLRKAKAFCKLM